MIIERCISLLLSATMFIEPYCIPLPSINNNDIQIEVSTPIIEQIEEPEIVEVEIIEIEQIEQEVVPETQLPLTDDEIDLIALVTMAEAEGEPEEGQRLVIDVILNRLDSSRFSDTIDGVIYAKNAFECMWNGRVNRCYVRDDIRQLVIEELLNRTNYEVLYFRTNHYHTFGTPVVSVGNHYFSTN